MVARRIDVLGSPREWTALPVGDPRRDDRYRRLAAIARVNLPRRFTAEQRAAAARAVRDDLIARTVWT